MSVRIELDEKALETAHNLFANAREQVRRAAGVAINRTLVTLRKEASITIREHYVIKAGKVKSSFTLHRAGRSSTRGSLVSKGNVLDLGNFRIREPKRGPVKVQVRKEGGLTPVRGLFVREGYKPMQRTTAAAYPLRVPQGPSVPQMFGNEDTLRELAPVAEETLNKRFLHEITYRYSKIYGGK